MSVSNPARKHHYVPQFYLSQWTGQDNRLWQYKRERSGKVGEKPVNAGGTGFQKDLYPNRKVASHPPQPDVIETQFFSPLDREASKVLKKLLSPTIPQLSDEERTSWALFLNSLLERNRRLLEERDRIAPTLLAKVLENHRARCQSDESR